MSREVIAVDIDEVLFPFIPEFVNFHNQRYGTELSPDHFLSYEFNHVLNITLKDTIERVYEFTGSDHRNVEPLERAQSAVSRLAEKFSLSVITARHPKFGSDTNAWLQEYFPDIFIQSRFIGYAPAMEKPLTKAEVCQEIGAIALIDDSLGHVSECAAQGLNGVLFGSYPWNQANSLPKGVTRCADWTEVLKHFDV